MIEMNGNFRFYGFCLIASVLLNGCMTGETEESNGYFSINQILRKQAEILVEKKASLEKMVSTNETSDTTIISHGTDTALWLEELDIFTVIDLSKPRLQGLYEVIDEKDKNSNLNIRTYLFKESKASIPQLKIWYLKDPENPYRVEASYVENNPGFQSERTMIMTFAEGSGQNLLETYHVKGEQKVVGLNPTVYEVTGKFIYEQ